ncbi:MAG: LptF/LptG family permease [Planctomycetota bacterium]
MPWTLYRYILWELLKLLVLSTAVLVVLLSFAAAIQPISDGKLSPALLLKFVAFTMPTVLGFALPFAGAFAATLVFIRMAGDNEVLACSASGVSYVRLLAPVLALGLVLTGGMLYLANYVVPGFYRMAERTVERDVVSLLVSRLNAQRFFEFPGEDLVIYADAANEFPPPPTPGSVLPMTQFVELRGVVVGELDERGGIGHDTTAERAVLQVYGGDASADAWGVFQLENVTRGAPSTGVLMSSGFTEIGPLRIPSLFSDNPKFLSAGDLDRYERRPELDAEVREKRQALTSAMATESLRRAFVRVKDRAVLQGALAGDRFVISVPRVEEEGELLRLSAEGGRPIRLERFTDGRVAGPPVRTYEAPLAFVKVRTHALSPEPTIDLELVDVTVTGAAGEPIVGNRSLQFRRLTWPRFLPDDLDDRPSRELLAEAGGQAYAGSETVAVGADRLGQVLRILKRNIVGQRHERAASAVSCALLLLLGAVLSIRLRDRPPLVVYFWSFLLAIVTLIIISSGVNVAGVSPASLAAGMAVVWSGNLLLLVLLLLAYRGLTRH